MNEEIKDLMDQIKNRMKELGATEVILYTHDNWGDLDDEIIEEHFPDTPVALNLFFNLTESYRGFSQTVVIPRKVKIENDEVLFDIGELYESDNDENEEPYEDQTIKDILYSCPEGTVKNCLEVILSDFLNNDEIIEYNNL